MGYRNYAPANGWIVCQDGNGNFTTIGDALSAASTSNYQGDIFISPGTYTENPALISGVNLVAWRADAIQGTVIINGECSFSATGTTTITGIGLQTNNNYFLSVTGSANSKVELVNCNCICSNNVGINLSSSGSGSEIYLNDCYGNISGATAALFSASGAGTIGFNYSSFGNSASSTTLSTTSGPLINIFWCLLNFPFSCSSTGSFNISDTIINTSFLNYTSITTGGSGGTSIRNSNIQSGSASAISVGSGTSVLLDLSNVSSSNSNAITGAGTLSYGGLIFESSNTINVTTQNPLPWTVQQGGTAASFFTSYAPVCAGTSPTGAFQSASAGISNSGYVLTSNGSSALPSWQAAAGGSFPFTDESSSFAAASNNGYFIASAATATLPASPSQGDRIAIVVDTSGSIIVQANTGQYIRRGTALSSSGGTFTNAQQGDTLDLYYRSADATWIDLGSNGAWTPA